MNGADRGPARVLHVTRDYPPRINGGISTAVGGLVEASVADGLACAVISFDGWRPRARGDGPAPPPVRRDAGPVPVLRVSAPDQLAAAHAFALEQRPELLHVHHDLLWPFAAEVRAALRVPAVATIHVLQAHQSRLRGLDHRTQSEAAQARVFAEADRVLAPSAAVAALVEELAPATAGRLDRVPLGVADSDEARVAAAGGRRRDDCLLYVGRFADINGFAELLEAVPAIALRRPTLRIVVAGGLPENRRAERRWLRRWEEHSSAAARAATRFAGWVDPRALSRLYAEATLLVAPSWFETFGLVVAEAMLHGVATATTGAGGLAELTGDDTVRLEARDPAALATAIAAAFDDPAALRELGRRGAARIRRGFGWERALPPLRRSYRAALG